MQRTLLLTRSGIQDSAGTCQSPQCSLSDSHPSASGHLSDKVCSTRRACPLEVAVVNAFVPTLFVSRGKCSTNLNPIIHFDQDDTQTPILSDHSISNRIWHLLTRGIMDMSSFSIMGVCCRTIHGMTSKRHIVLGTWVVSRGEDDVSNRIPNQHHSTLHSPKPMFYRNGDRAQCPR